MAKVPTFSEQQIDYFMQEALNEAKLAGDEGEVPIGAVIVFENQIIARAHNHRERNQLATAHAELIAIERANQVLQSWRLEDTALFVTLEPCIMCAGAIINARVPAVYYGAQDAKGGATQSLYHLLEDQRLNHRVFVQSDVRAKESSRLLQQFFAKIRAKRKQK
ncbi:MULTISPECIES: tRNA adenosine(34) deaminase TadA [Leuconostoc]|jgi:tRNA(adenine34) deaminase|uniref:tRNA adenosine(34) deaminase TadA n=1 Tax=Leuconostoc TaxID=1243 RepID=UPI0011DE0E1C|nr:MULTISPECIES: tRNA adenosine(34) deaminase TadA [Leuconostoc]MBK0040925.1 nucleoside deaminase [Leuconostoc sp. S51]MBK0051960.1 nucleoside deaminase [Leuconostoc sp. S50]MBS0958386.1 nucleoside deaminase [Leuconostoc pseudomesenteroides]MCT4380060.1 nucleoside deaminase [Leuconostoc pseudomesenteroides]MCT4412906.1 nucleoside deaminase [Leuconostoc pseudomesenteroides]